MNALPSNPPRVLNSWKEIAQYVGRGIRTVQRWEQFLDFPVRRPHGKSRSAVIAMADEIDAWLRSAPLNGDHQLSDERQGVEPRLVRRNGEFATAHRSHQAAKLAHSVHTGMQRLDASARSAMTEVRRAIALCERLKKATPPRYER